MDSLVVPAPADSPLGSEKERGISFGGGGEWFVAFSLAYGETMAANGVDLARADVTVGTSAGSIMGAYVTSGAASQAAQQWAQLAAHPEVLEALVPTVSANPSQSRATQSMIEAASIGPEAIREIGRAAMAAQNPPVAGYIAVSEKILGMAAWPSPAHHVTAVDCFTGERIVIGPDSGISIAAAAAASSSLPGINGPTWIGDHYCMDGGVSTSSTHADLLAGAKRVLIFSMLSLEPGQASSGTAFGLAERLSPGTARREAAYLEAKGSKVALIVGDPPAGIDFMDPKQLASAMELGAERATADLDRVAAVWND